MAKESPRLITLPHDDSRRQRHAPPYKGGAEKNRENLNENLKVLMNSIDLIRNVFF